MRVREIVVRWSHGAGRRNRKSHCGGSEVGMVQSLRRRNTFVWVELKESLEQVDGLWRCLRKHLLEGNLGVSRVLLRGRCLLLAIAGGLVGVSAFLQM